MSNRHFSGGSGVGASSWQSTRRSFLAGLGTVAGLGLASGTGQAQRFQAPDEAGSVFYVGREAGPGNGGGTANGQGSSDVAGTSYTVVDGDSGEAVFTTDGTAEPAFQYAFDELATTGGTVVASGDTFQFGAPATVRDNTVLRGQRGTRFVASRTGTSDDPAPGDDQTNPLPTGHDLVRLRGDDVAVVGITFDADGTQLDNNAVQADKCDGLLVANNRTVNGFQMAISFTRCTDVTVVGNDVVDPNWYGITSRAAPTGSERDLRQSTDVVLADNRVTGVKFNNIAPYNVSNFAVVGNVVADGGHSLIACSPAQQGAIVGNVCRNLTEFAPDPGGEAGIEIEYKESHLRSSVAGTERARSYDITITGNQVDNCPVGVLARTVPAGGDEAAPRRAQRPYSFTVTGNTISDASDAGIRIRSGAAGVLATNSVRAAGTDVDVADSFVENLERGLNVTR